MMATCEIIASLMFMSSPYHGVVALVNQIQVAFQPVQSVTGDADSLADPRCTVLVPSVDVEGPLCGAIQLDDRVLMREVEAGDVSVLSRHNDTLPHSVVVARTHPTEDVPYEPLG